MIVDIQTRRLRTIGQLRAFIEHRGQRGGDLSSPGSGRGLRLRSGNAGALRPREARQAGQGGVLFSFPFPILGVHADNGSECINQRVAALLGKLRVGRFTKSRARHSNDNALVEGKNANVIRNWFDHDHVPQRFAPEVSRFAQAALSPSPTSTAPACSPPSTGTARAGHGTPSRCLQAIEIPTNKAPDADPGPGLNA